MKALKDKKIKYILIIAAVVFALFLCIYYWPNISSLIGVLLSATTPLLLGCAIAYPLNILMSFYK